MDTFIRFMVSRQIYYLWSLQSIGIPYPDKLCTTEGRQIKMTGCERSITVSTVLLTHSTTNLKRKTTVYFLLQFFTFSLVSTIIRICITRATREFNLEFVNQQVTRAVMDPWGCIPTSLQIFTMFTWCRRNTAFLIVCNKLGGRQLFCNLPCLTFSFNHYRYTSW
jgi:hypothetical protein